jgi:hypothetical protein
VVDGAGVIDGKPGEVVWPKKRKKKTILRRNNLRLNNNVTLTID